MTVTDIFHPDWQPGKRTIEKAEKRAKRTGMSFERALQEQIADSRAAVLITHARNALDAEEGRELRATIKAQRKVYSAPSSVRAVPTGFETSRRRH